MLAIGIGKRNTAPCSAGTNSAGQRRTSALRRSHHSSAAARDVYVETISEARMTRALAEANIGQVDSITQISAPKLIDTQRILRPWKRRAALQIIPQENSRRALGSVSGTNGTACGPAIHSAAAKPPIR